MKCYHYMPSAPDPKTWCPQVWHALQLPNGSYFACHAGPPCPDKATRLPHILRMEKVSAEVATALASYGVLATDTLACAAIKMAEKTIPGFEP